MKNLPLLALLGLAAGFCQAGRPIQLEDYYRIEGAATPAISPDGRWVVFARSTIVEAENHDIAAKAFANHPHLTIPESSIEVVEVRAMG